jgi:hypothetical protein
MFIRRFTIRSRPSPTGTINLQKLIAADADALIFILLSEHNQHNWSSCGRNEGAQTKIDLCAPVR